MPHLKRNGDVRVTRGLHLRVQEGPEEAFPGGARRKASHFAPTIADDISSAFQPTRLDAPWRDTMWYVTILICAFVLGFFLAALLSVGACAERLQREAVTDAASQGIRAA